LWQGWQQFPTKTWQNLRLSTPGAPIQCKEWLGKHQGTMCTKKKKMNLKLCVQTHSWLATVSNQNLAIVYLFSTPIALKMYLGLAIITHVPQTMQNLVISCFCFTKDGEEIYRDF